MYNTNGARWAMINSCGAEKSHWGMVYGILKNKEQYTDPSQSYGQKPVFCYEPRKTFKPGTDGLCLHCHKPPENHTPSKKYCQKVRVTT